jgi:hypothetical protein
MNPIKINIDVNLGEETLKVMRELAIELMTRLIAGINAGVKDGESEDMPDFDAAPKAEAGVAQAAPETPAPVPAATQAKVISDDDIARATRETVARLKAAGQSPLIVRTEVFAKYNINQSTECPATSREAFLADLEKLGR